MSVSGTGIEQVRFGGRSLARILASKASSVGQHTHGGHEQARSPVTSTGRREIVAGLSMQARNLSLLFCRPAPPMFSFERGEGGGTSSWVYGGNFGLPPLWFLFLY